jgi:hypothetical protein
MLTRCVASVLALLVGSACGGPTESTTDAAAIRDSGVDAVVVDAAVVDAAGVDGGLDASAIDAAIGDAGTDAPHDVGVDATTCGNGVEDPSESCCTDEDRAALLASLVPSDGASVVYCVPRGQAGSFGTFGTGARYCTGTVVECSEPACAVNGAGSTWALSSTGTGEVLDVMLPFDTSTRLDGQVVGIPISCDAALRGSLRLTMSFEITDSGTHLGVTTRSVDYSNDVLLTGCASFGEVTPDIVESIVGTVIIETTERLDAAEHACAF